MVNKLYIGCIGCTRGSTIPAFVDYPNESRDNLPKCLGFGFRETGMVSIARCSWVLSWVCLPLVTGPYKTFCGPARGIWTMLRSPPGTLTRSLAPAQLHSTPFHSPRSRAHGGLPHASMRSDFFGRVDALSFSFRGKES